MIIHNIEYVPIFGTHTAKEMLKSFRPFPLCTAYRVALVVFSVVVGLNRRLQVIPVYVGNANITPYEYSLLGKYTDNY